MSDGLFVLLSKVYKKKHSKTGKATIAKNATDILEYKYKSAAHGCAENAKQKI